MREAVPIIAGGAGRTARAEPPFDLFLASRSPRRRELLDQLGVRYRVCPADIPEEREAGESPAAYVERMARSKARAALVARTTERPVLGADTDVVLGEEVLGKPADQADAARMLRALAGQTHQVMSAVAIADGSRLLSRLQVTEVTFGPLDAATIDAYWATGEPADKAGAYGIQGLGAIFITRIAGSYSGVMGLPLHETAALLEAFGIPTLGRAA